MPRPRRRWSSPVRCGGENRWLNVSQNRLKDASGRSYSEALAWGPDGNRSAANGSHMAWDRVDDATARLVFIEQNTNLKPESLFMADLYEVKNGWTTLTGS